MHLLWVQLLLLATFAICAPLHKETKLVGQLPESDVSLHRRAAYATRDLLEDKTKHQEPAASLKEASISNSPDLAKEQTQIELTSPLSHALSKRSPGAPSVGKSSSLFISRSKPRPVVSPNGPKPLLEHEFYSKAWTKLESLDLYPREMERWHALYVKINQANKYSREQQDELLETMSRIDGPLGKDVPWWLSGFGVSHLPLIKRSLGDFVSSAKSLRIPFI